MNTVFLARALARNLRVEDPGNPHDEAVLDILTAINAGISEYYQLAPEIYRKTSIRTTLRAPEAITVEFAGKYLPDVTSPEFLSRQIGCTLRVAGYSMDNRIASETTVLEDWLGDDGEHAATIYNDAVAINATIDRITSAVKLRGLTGETVLIPDTPRFLDYANSVSRPERYWMEPIGINQGGQTTALMRVYPCPDADYILAFDAVLSNAQTVTFLDLIDAAELPVSQKYAENILLPICEAKLTSSPLWMDPKTKRDAMARAEGARGNLSLLPATLNPPTNKCRTQSGY